MPNRRTESIVLVIIFLVVGFTLMALIEPLLGLVNWQVDTLIRGRMPAASSPIALTPTNTVQIF